MDPLKSNPLVSVPAEMAFIGSLLFDYTVIPDVAGDVKPEMFADPAHGIIFSSILDVHLSGRKVDLVLMCDELGKLGKLKAVGGADYLMALVDGVPNASSAKAYADIIRDRWQRRILVQMVDFIKADVADLSKPFDAMTSINRAIVAVGEAQGAGAVLFLNELISEAMNLSIPTTSPVVTRIGKVDANINLFCPGELTIIAARPSVGKSSLMRQMCVNAATAGTALVFSLEVTPKVLALQFACEIAGVPYWTYSHGKATEEQMERVAIAASDRALDGIAVYNKTNLSALDISLAVTQLRAKGKPISAVFIDYLGLMRHDKAERHDLAVGATTRLLKQIAIERQIPVILLAQLNRDVERRGGDKDCDRPRLADLRDSGNIEQDADNVIFLWRKERDDQYKTVEPRIFTVAKHRNGQVFEVDLMFDKEKARFYEVNDRGQAPPVAEWYSK